MGDSVGTDAQSLRKRKRAAVACTICHGRKVRCNVAFVGTPCSNCAQDGIHCKVYGQQPEVRPGQPIRPRGASLNVNASYPLTPSPASANASEVPRHTTEVPVRTRDSAPRAASPASISSSGQYRRQSAVVPGESPEVLANARRERSPDDDPATNLVPYYAGEAEGLEFLFDIASPNRPLKGAPYIIARNAHKREFTRPLSPEKLRPSLPTAACEQLMRCFFHYVYPFMPVINAGDFLVEYTQDPTKVSRVLLWSVFFASANFLRQDAVNAAGFKTRKSLKEYCYQNAKTLYDSQREPDKTATIASALLLAYWYVDLEDLDGSWSWMGIASSLCQGIGLHREPNYARIPRCPFPASQQALWRRLWWCCYYRDAWLAVGFGRPMRLHLDDCDVRLPSIDDVFSDLNDLPGNIRHTYMPTDLEALAGLWIKLLQLSIKLEDVLLLHYRPRRPPLSIAQMERDDTETWQLLDTLPREAEYCSQTLTLHLCHLKCYFNTVTITLHRSYINHQPNYLTPVEQESLKTVALQRCKNAAASTTNNLNRLISLELIELSPAMLVTAMMVPMQIHLYEYANHEGLGRQHAYHNLKLHMMVLSHLKTTYWTADMQHNLFTHCLKAMDSGKAEQPSTTTEALPLEPTSTYRAPNGREDHPYEVNAGLDAASLGAAPLDEFFWTFNPFYTMQPMFDQSTADGWNPANSLHLNHP